MPSSSSSPPKSSDKGISSGTSLNPLDQISGNASPTIKQAFHNPVMIFATLDREGKYRVLGFAMETIFQRVLVTTISCSNPHGGQGDLLQSKSNMDAQPSCDGDLNEGHPQSIILVCEVDVYPDMANNYHILHGGCTAFLIDMCSSLTVVALTMTMNSKPTEVASFPPEFNWLTQTLNVVYHSPSPVGDKLRIVCTTMPLRELSSNVCVRSEIWSTNRHRLVASGVHNMMKMSSKLKTSISRL
ncbi:hypothetical protein F5879DRAFT_537885 [Lentinula edodes]|nr:hypothetical protein F5879DRAFT_537885 [Lentinula edodes]